MPAKELVEKILRLKEETGAVILAHNYQPPEIQDVADHLGDSLDLSRLAARLEEEIIIFCGVHFMAETAAILSPDKKVILPDPDAGCPMADMIDAAQLRALQEKHPGAVTVMYVNSTAEVKALTDICCTSANALAVIDSIPEDDKIIFGPDQYLGRVGIAADRPRHDPVERVLPVTPEDHARRDTGTQRAASRRGRHGSSRGQS